MKTDNSDPWCGIDAVLSTDNQTDNRFEDCFVQKLSQKHEKLSDSEQYLEKLYSKLNDLRGGTSKRDLVNSLTAVKEDCIARLIFSEQNFQPEEETELSSTPLIRHIAPHLQALTASELVHLLKADVLQVNAESELCTTLNKSSTCQERTDKQQN